MTPNYIAMVRGVRELHRLMVLGKEDSLEANAIRDSTDGPWEALSEVERDRIRYLSEDLYSLVEPAPPAQPLTSQAKAKLVQFFEARQERDWDQALNLLRALRTYLDPGEVSYWRGLIWLQAGDPDLAKLFFEHAQQTLADNSHPYSSLLYFSYTENSESLLEDKVYKFAEESDVVAQYVFFRDESGRPANRTNEKNAPVHLLSEIGITSFINENGEVNWKGENSDELEYNFDILLNAFVIRKPDESILNQRDTFDIVRRSLTEEAKKSPVNRSMPVRC